MARITLFLFPASPRCRKDATPSPAPELTFFKLFFPLLMEAMLLLIHLLECPFHSALIPDAHDAVSVMPSTLTKQTPGRQQLRTRAPWTTPSCCSRNCLYVYDLPLQDQ